MRAGKRLLAVAWLALGWGACGSVPEPYAVFGGRFALCPGELGCHYEVLEKVPADAAYGTGMSLQLYADVRDEVALRALIDREVCKADGEAVIVKRSPMDGRYLSAEIIRYMPDSVRSNGKPCISNEAMFQSREQCPHAWGVAKPKTITRIKSNKPKLSICSRTVGTIVRIDGDEVGRTPLSLQVSAGEHDIELTVGELSWQAPVEVGEHEEVQLTLPL